MHATLPAACTCTIRSVHHELTHSVHCTGTSMAAAAMPVAAERDTVSSGDVSASRVAGVTADEPVPAAEASSVSVEPEEAAEQTEQLASAAEAASATAASADANGSSAAAPDAAAAPAEAAAAAVEAAGVTSVKPQRRQQDGQRAPARRFPRQEQQERVPTGPVEPIPKVTLRHCTGVHCHVLQLALRVTSQKSGIALCSPLITLEIILAHYCRRTCGSVTATWCPARWTGPTLAAPACPRCATPASSGEEAASAPERIGHRTARCPNSLTSSALHLELQTSARSAAGVTRAGAGWQKAGPRTDMVFASLLSDVC